MPATVTQGLTAHAEPHVRIPAPRTRRAVKGERDTYTPTAADRRTARAAAQG